MSNDNMFSIIMPEFDVDVEPEKETTASLEGLEAVVNKPELKLTAMVMDDNEVTAMENLTIMGDDASKQQVNPINSIFVFRKSREDKAIKRVDVHITDENYKIEKLLSVLRQLPENTPVHVYFVASLPRTKASALATAISMCKADITAHLISIASPTMLEAAFHANHVEIDNITTIRLIHSDESSYGCESKSIANSVDLMDKLNKMATQNLVARNVITQEEADAYNDGKGLYLNHRMLQERAPNFVIGSMPLIYHNNIDIVE